MNELLVLEHKGRLVADNRHVAELVGKRHTELLRSIDGYAKHLENAGLRSQNFSILETPNLGSLDFFISGKYTIEGHNKKYPMYHPTRKGCDMVANKMTGAKGANLSPTT